MKKWLILIIAALFAMPLIAGCGQKQEAEKKPLVMKPPVSIAEEADTDEEAQFDEVLSSTQSLPKTAAEPAADSAAAAQSPQEQHGTVEVSTVAGQDAATLPSGQARPGAPSLGAEELVIADFDSGEKPNNLDGNFGAWNKDPQDAAQWCKESFDNAVRHGEKGFAMRLDYSVESPNPAYNGFWMMLPNFDASKYDNLAFLVKGDSKEGYTTVFKVELKNASKQIGRFYVSNVSDQWQQVLIPLSEFKGLLDRSSLTELVIVFEDRIASNKRGVIYVDDFKFTKQ
ncbi:MAG: hypothetical protein A3I73_04465 [Omnitrophica bacterium RIFCSPLOWO2_02_FULL_45_16]|nr:MAG: hypothetical protein A3G36_00085 [Omnitrophica bacterium RIFCSPLOWO2_12_FULL_45_13]OGW95112.1 MAG: hypothetical protein A3K16_04490 [Omnitrophica bacterium RIFCSPLOWO2_01_FULL_45_24]OGX00061.1 MAG: hypothetical protein A3I73_04465 [Omnitrophica bacterium RIFCSPLOWO2_02_FULL_45_16]